MLQQKLALVRQCMLRFSGHKFDCQHECTRRTILNTPIALRQAADLISAIHCQPQQDILLPNQRTGPPAHLRIPQYCTLKYYADQPWPLNAIHTWDDLFASASKVAPAQIPLPSLVLTANSSRVPLYMYATGTK